MPPLEEIPLQEKYNPRRNTRAADYSLQLAIGTTRGMLPKRYVTLRSTSPADFVERCHDSTGHRRSDHRHLQQHAGGTRRGKEAAG